MIFVSVCTDICWKELLWLGTVKQKTDLICQHVSLPSMGVGKMYCSWCICKYIWNLSCSLPVWNRSAGLDFAFDIVPSFGVCQRKREKHKNFINSSISDEQRWSINCQLIKHMHMYSNLRDSSSYNNLCTCVNYVKLVTIVILSIRENNSHRTKIFNLYDRLMCSYFLKSITV